MYVACAAVRFSNGEIVQVRVPQSRLTDVLCFPGLFSDDEAFHRQHLEEIAHEVIEAGTAVSPFQVGMVAIDWTTKSVIEHLPQPAGFDCQFATSALRGKFVKHAADAGRAYFRDGAAAVKLTTDMVDRALALISRPSGVKPVAGAGRVAWLTGEVAFDLAGWKMRSHRQDHAGYADLLSDLATMGFAVDEEAQSSRDWLADIPQAA